MENFTPQIYQQSLPLANGNGATDGPDARLIHLDLGRE